MLETLFAWKCPPLVTDKTREVRNRTAHHSRKSGSVEGGVLPGTQGTRVLHVFFTTRVVTMIFPVLRLGSVVQVLHVVRLRLLENSGEKATSLIPTR